MGYLKLAVKFKAIILIALSLFLSEGVFSAESYKSRNFCVEKVYVCKDNNHLRFIFDSSRKIEYRSYFKQNTLTLDVLTLHCLQQAQRLRQFVDLKVLQRKTGLRLVFYSKRLLSAHIFVKKKNTKSQLVVTFLTSAANRHYAADQQHNRNIRVIIDPGHGGRDPGATAPGGTREKDVVLMIAKKLKSTIDAQPGFEAVLTREHDVYLSLRRRLVIARDYKADLFIALHADAYFNTLAHGASVYALSKVGATSEVARWLAQKENTSQLIGGVRLLDKEHALRSVLINLSQTDTIKQSLVIGQQVIRFLRSIAPLHAQKVEQAAFVVLKAPDIPSLLIELGFLSNPIEEKRLCAILYQKRLVSAITHGVVSYFTYRPPRGTWLFEWQKKRNIWIF